MFFVKFFWHLDVIFLGTVISLKIVLLSNKHQCYFLHFSVNLILKTIKKYSTIYESYKTSQNKSMLLFSWREFYQERQCKSPNPI